MSGCPDCAAAATEPHHGFRSGCKGCQARSFARSMLYWQASMSGKQFAAYREQLGRLGLTHADVKAAAAADALITGAGEATGGVVEEGSR